MKLSQNLKRKLGAATPYILALLLAVAILPGAALANPGPPPPDDDSGNNPQKQVPPPPGNTPVPPPPSNTPVPPPPSNTPVPPPPQNLQPPPPNPPSPVSAPSAHPDAPEFPSADCIVTHAATPAQLCPIAGGLQYYFIGADGSSQAGPYIKPFSELATLHTVGASVRLYTGSNPFTGKSVHIDYLPADNKLRISTYYPDTQYDTDKPYTFTVDSGNSVSQEAW